MKTQREREQEKKQSKLADMERQIESGSLVIRQMTTEERDRNPPRERPPRRGGTSR